jgi:hypothetical protein
MGWFKPLIIFVLSAALAITILGAPGAWSQPVAKDQLLALYNQVRKSVIDQDLEGFHRMVIPPDPSVKKMTPEEFAGFKAFLAEILPDPANMKFIRFSQKDDEAIIIFRSQLEDKEDITLTPFRFIREKSGWKLWANFASKTFSAAAEPAENDQAIAKELKGEMFQLGQKPKK